MLPLQPVAKVHVIAAIALTDTCMCVISNQIEDWNNEDECGIANLGVTILHIHNRHEGLSTMCLFINHYEGFRLS